MSYRNLAIGVGTKMAAEMFDDSGESGGAIVRGDLRFEMDAWPLQRQGALTFTEPQLAAALSLACERALDKVKERK